MVHSEEVLICNFSKKLKQYFATEYLGSGVFVHPVSKPLKGNSLSIVWAERYGANYRRALFGDWSQKSGMKHNVYCTRITEVFEYKYHDGTSAALSVADIELGLIKQNIGPLSKPQRLFGSIGALFCRIGGNLSSFCLSLHFV